MLIILKELKDSLNKKEQPLSLMENYFKVKLIMIATAFPLLPNYLQYWLLLPPGNCSLKTLDKKFQKQSVRFKLHMTLR